jgi:hypothetical protein
LGVFVVAASFSAAQAAFVGLIQFDTDSSPFHAAGTLAEDKGIAKTGGADASIQVVVLDHDKLGFGSRNETGIEMTLPTSTMTTHSDASYIDLLTQTTHDGEETNFPRGSSPPSVNISSFLNRSCFVLPLLVAILCWAIMAMPMSIVRATMRELGFTDRQSLTVIEFHFLSMYFPGFWTGNFIRQYGSISACQVAIGCFLLGTAINLSSQANQNTATCWFLGMIFLGAGWNFGYSCATLWLTKAYQDAPNMKTKVQAANECGTFLCSGGLIFSTGFIYNNAGGGGLNGWRTLNLTIIGFISLLSAVVALAGKHARRNEKIRRTDESTIAQATIAEDGSGVEMSL